MSLSNGFMRRVPRDFSTLHYWILYGTKVKVDALGATSHATFIGNSFVTKNGYRFYTPSHFVEYHMKIHGSSSKPAGWNYVVLSEGPDEGISIAKIYDRNNSRFF